MTTIRRITKKEAFKRFVEGQDFWVTPCKMQPFHPWGFTMKGPSLSDYMPQATWYAPDGLFPSEILWKGTIEKTAWDLFYNNWSYYNTNRETGYYATYWVR